MTNMTADTSHRASPPDPPEDQPGTPMPEDIAVVLHAGRHPARLRPPPPRHCPLPCHRPHIPLLRGLLRHRQPLHHPRPPEPGHPARHSAAALPAGARRNRPRHQHRDPTHPHRGGNTAHPSSPPTRATSRPTSRAQSRAPPVTASRLGRPELFMPTLEDLERQVRRRTVGRTIEDICRDLAVVP